VAAAGIPLAATFAIYLFLLAPLMAELGVQRPELISVEETAPEKYDPGEFRRVLLVWVPRGLGPGLAIWVASMWLLESWSQIFYVATVLITGVIGFYLGKTRAATELIPSPARPLVIPLLLSNSWTSRSVRYQVGGWRLFLRLRK
jgi:hypothetical protein